MTRRAYVFFLLALLVALPLAAYSSQAPDVTVQQCYQYNPTLANTRHDLCATSTGELVDAAPYANNQENER